MRDEIPDNLTELERRIKQAKCPHANTVEVTKMGGAREYLCADCGLVIEKHP